MYPLSLSQIKKIMSKTEEVIITKTGSGYIMSKVNPITPLVDFRSNFKHPALNEWGVISIECNLQKPETVVLRLMAYQPLRQSDPKRNLVASVHLTPDEIKSLYGKALQVCVEAKRGVFHEENEIDVLRGKLYDMEEEKKGFLLKIRDLEKQLKVFTEG